MRNQGMKPYSHKMWPNWSWFYCFQWYFTHPVECKMGQPARTL